MRKSDHLALDLWSLIPKVLRTIPADPRLLGERSERSECKN